MDYVATAGVDGSIWRVEVPDIGQVETEYLARVEFEARALIAEKAGVDPDSFEVAVSYRPGSPASWTDPDGYRFRMVAFGAGARRYVPLG